MIWKEHDTKPASLLRRTTASPAVQISMLGRLPSILNDETRLGNNGVKPFHDLYDQVLDGTKRGDRGSFTVIFQSPDKFLLLGFLGANLSKD